MEDLENKTAMEREMTGEELFNVYRQLASQRVGAPGREYARSVVTAFMTVGPERLYPLLEEAERTGQQIELAYPIPIEEGPSEPSGISLTKPFEVTQLTIDLY